MLNNSEIALLRSAETKLRDKIDWKDSIGESFSSFSLYNALVRLAHSVPSCYGIAEILEEKPEEVLIWCMSVRGGNLELPFQLDKDNKLSVVLDVWNGNSIDHVLELSLNGLKYLNLEYDNNTKMLHQYTYADPHNDDFTHQQQIDVLAFNETSYQEDIANLEERFGVDIKISPVPEQDGFVYGIIVGRESSNRNTITTNDYNSIGALLTDLEHVILPEYQKMVKSFVNLNSITKSAKIV